MRIAFFVHFIHILLTAHAQPDSYEWNPYNINESCPLYTFATLDNTCGLGDNLERFVFTLWVAKALGTAVIVTPIDGKDNEYLGSDKYVHITRDVLKINFATTKQFFDKKYVPKLGLAPKNRTLTLNSFNDMKDKISQGLHVHECNTMYSFSINDCPEYPEGWCDFLPTYTRLRDVAWVLRQGGARQNCLNSNLGIPSSQKSINVVIHIRNGDVCDNCDDASYLENLIHLVQTSLDVNQTIFEKSIAVTVESWRPLKTMELIQQKFPSVDFVHGSRTDVTVCRFLTSDILVTTGSSLPPFVGAFAPPLTPVIFEDIRKEAYRFRKSNLDINIAQHFTDGLDSILMVDAVPIMSKFEVRGLINVALGSKLASLRQ